MELFLIILVALNVTGLIYGCNLYRNPEDRGWITLIIIVVNSIAIMVFIIAVLIEFGRLI